MTVKWFQGPEALAKAGRMCLAWNDTEGVDAAGEAAWPDITMSKECSQALAGE